MQTPMGGMPFMLTFCIEVLLLVEVRIPNFWMSQFTKEGNDEALKANLDLIEEV